MRERILEFLKTENKTSAQFAEEIGVQPSGISHILSGRNKPSLDFVLKMLDTYSYISPEWLLFGREKMYRKQSVPDLFNQLQEELQESDGSITDLQKSENLNKPEKEKISGESLPQNEISPGPEVEKIVWFYTNNSFREYYPEKE
ncbi:MAG: helix-turn-helix transcriptional regulator [Bacteroidales bacterium]|jgi:transcriptional regulator with XRE-family HTH domain|nr:helix-turn-helix transcriptional regulator [Bacteroidales bacterium]